MQGEPPSCQVILSGCSGGGKSTLLAELGRRGYATVAEPGRRIVAEESRGTGKALPWVDPTAFAKRAIAMAIADRAGVAGADGFVFFDRGLIDAAAALERAARVPVMHTLHGQPRFHALVFVTPPWPAIYQTDGERQHSMAAAVDEYRHLLMVYERLGYTTVVLPKTDVGARADMVLGRLAVSG
ncbi:MULTISPECIES: AAA family ATPase [unclassified Yoonia]|uniref:AAA family ATPase n=1 Tax=unclassified Yoonia TaxID=2629118 RepID=UPI002B0004B9|nr:MULTISPECIES: AAA family ATPase [unclassified Yoonia]